MRTREEVQKVVFAMLKRSLKLTVLGEKELRKTVSELGADSMDTVDFELALEKRLGIKMPENSILVGTTVGQVIGKAFELCATQQAKQPC